VLQLAGLIGLYVYHLHIEKTGKTYLIKCQPIDPTDLLSGDYISLRYEMTSTHKLLFNQVESLNSKNSIVAVTLGQSSWRPMQRTARGALLFLFLCGCTVSREVPFNEAAFVGTSAPGTGIVTGHAYGVLNDDKAVDADHEIVVLTPVTPYTTENVRRRFVKGENLQSADPRIDKYLRSATTDAKGYFTIREIPPGDYYVESKVDWTTSHQEIFDDGSESTMYADHDRLIFARVSVKNNQTVRVTSWDQTSPIHNAFYAYGGTFDRPQHRLLSSP